MSRFDICKAMNAPGHETIHSGNLMSSNVHSSRREEEEIEVEVNPEKDGAAADKPVTFYKFTPDTTKSVAIDVSLNKLYHCVQLAYQTIATPKWKKFSGMKLIWKDRIRLNNVIWRAWYTQFICKGKPKFCYFSLPDEDQHNKAEATVIEGMYWKRRQETVGAEYRRWRVNAWKELIYKNRRTHKLEMGIRRRDSLDDALLLPYPSNLSPLAGLEEDEWNNIFTDNLFSSLNQPYLFPNPKEMAQAGNADFIQPGLIQLQPSVEEIMASLGFEPCNAWAAMLTSNNEQLQSEFNQPNEVRGTALNHENLAVSSDDTKLYNEERHMMNRMDVSRSCVSTDAPMNAADVPQNQPQEFIEKEFGPAMRSYQTLAPTSQPDYGISQPSVGMNEIDVTQPYIPQIIQSRGRMPIAPKKRFHFVSREMGMCDDHPKADKDDPVLAKEEKQTSEASQMRPISTFSAPDNSSVVKQVLSRPSVTSVLRPQMIKADVSSCNAIATRDASSVLLPTTFPTASGNTKDKRTKSSAPAKLELSAAKSKSGDREETIEALKQHCLQQQSRFLNSNTGAAVKYSPQLQAGLCRESVCQPVSSAALASHSTSLMRVAECAYMSPPSAYNMTHSEIDEAAAIGRQSRNLCRSNPHLSILSDGSSGICPATSASAVIRNSSVVRPVPINLSSPGRSSSEAVGSAFSAISPISPVSCSSPKLQPMSASKYALPAVSYHHRFDESASASTVHISRADVFEASNCLVNKPADCAGSSSSQAPLFIMQSFPALSVMSLRSPTLSSSTSSITQDFPGDGVRTAPAPVAPLESKSVLSASELQPAAAVSKLAKEQKTQQKVSTKRAADSTEDATERKRMQHLQSEHSRRCALKTGFEQLETLLPNLGQEGAKITNAVVLMRAAQHIREVKSRLDQTCHEIDAMKTKAEDLSSKINACQNHLPTGNSEIKGSSSMQIMFNNYIKQRGGANNGVNWKFLLLAELIRPMFDSFCQEVSGQHVTELQQSAVDWAKANCQLATLRPALSKMLVDLATETTVLRDASCLKSHILSKAGIRRP